MTEKVLSEAEMRYREARVKLNSIKEQLAKFVEAGTDKSSIGGLVSIETQLDEQNDNTIGDICGRKYKLAEHNYPINSKRQHIEHQPDLTLPEVGKIEPMDLSVDPPTANDLCYNPLLPILQRQVCYAVTSKDGTKLLKACPYETAWVVTATEEMQILPGTSAVIETGILLYIGENVYMHVEGIPGQSYVVNGALLDEYDNGKLNIIVSNPFPNITLYVNKGDIVAHVLFHEVGFPTPIESKLADLQCFLNHLDNSRKQNRFPKFAKGSSPTFFPVVQPSLLPVPENSRAGSVHPSLHTTNVCKVAASNTTNSNAPTHENKDKVESCLGNPLPHIDNPFETISNNSNGTDEQAGTLDEVIKMEDSNLELAEKSAACPELIDLTLAQDDNDAVVVSNDILSFEDDQIDIAMMEELDSFDSTTTIPRIGKSIWETITSDDDDDDDDIDSGFGSSSYTKKMPKRK
ncbi:unnamed protein product [Orchesella dallaii]|uniref:Uncharacterized protein n=1 Tax=Orchesella dallaii TaxID=48710 RepID=A0ABP1QVE2_9HEXA